MTLFKTLYPKALCHFTMKGKKETKIYQGITKIIH